MINPNAQGEEITSKKFKDQCSLQFAYLVETFYKTIGDKKKVLEAGDGYYVAPDELHGCICLEEGVLIDVCAPVRADFLGI